MRNQRNNTVFSLSLFLSCISRAKIFYVNQCTYKYTENRGKLKPDYIQNVKHSCGKERSGLENIFYNIWFMDLFEACDLEEQKKYENVLALQNELEMFQSESMKFGKLTTEGKEYAMHLLGKQFNLREQKWAKVYGWNLANLQERLVQECHRSFGQVEVATLYRDEIGFMGRKGFFIQIFGRFERE